MIASRYSALALALLFAGCRAASSSPPNSPTPSPTVSPTPTTVPTATPAPALPLGTVASSTIACPSGVPSGATCQSLTVTCPGLPDIVAQAAITEPVSSAVGTVAMLFGGGGTMFFDQGFPAGYLGKGLRVVQFAFASDWPAASGAGVKAASCRPATLFRWAFDVPHAASTATAFCVHGHSGGSGALGETLTHYGGKSFIDYAVEDAGPVFGRIDLGCDSSIAGTTRYVCPALPAGPFNYTTPLINTWEGTSSCGMSSPSAGDVTKWHNDSVVTSDGDFSYANTLVHFWFCANNPNEAAGQGSFFVDALSSSKVVSCATGSCSVEPAWTDAATKQTMIDTMGVECLPRH